MSATDSVDISATVGGSIAGIVDASVTGRTSAEIVQAANETQQVIIKTIKPINGKDGYFRITPGTPEECERFMAFVEAYF